MNRRWMSILAVCLVLIAVFGAVAILRLPEGTVLPVLMYHHLDENEASTMVVSPEHFEEQIAALVQSGYSTVTGRQIIDYVENNGTLPEKPVWITFDDGYTSNITLAAPILEKYGMCATIFVIGTYAGQTYSPHTGTLLTPSRFSYEEVRPYVEKGVLEVQSHTYDMHLSRKEGFDGREGVLRLSCEDIQTYKTVLTTDIQQSAQQLRQELDVQLYALAYPYGYWSKESENILKKIDVSITLTTRSGFNYLVPGEPESMRLLHRYLVTGRHTGKDVINMLNSIDFGLANLVS
jgi:peptidoglycan/xylan/chitin deacetylase (PgdA/CDA1 family)